MTLGNGKFQNGFPSFFSQYLMLLVHVKIASYEAIPTCTDDICSIDLRFYTINCFHKLLNYLY